jgi:hypothetical protein
LPPASRAGRDIILQIRSLWGRDFRILRPRCHAIGKHGASKTSNAFQRVKPDQAAVTAYQRRRGGGAHASRSAGCARRFSSHSYHSAVYGVGHPGNAMICRLAGAALLFSARKLPYWSGTRMICFPFIPVRFVFDFLLMLRAPISFGCLLVGMSISARLAASTR